MIFSCPAGHAPDWQPRILLPGMVEALSVSVKNTYTHKRIHTTREMGTYPKCLTLSPVHEISVHEQSYSFDNFYKGDFPWGIGLL